MDQLPIENDALSSPMPRVAGPSCSRSHSAPAHTTCHLTPFSSPHTPSPTGPTSSSHHHSPPRTTHHPQPLHSPHRQTSVHASLPTAGPSRQPPALDQPRPLLPPPCNPIRLSSPTSLPPSRRPGANNPQRDAPERGREHRRRHPHRHVGHWDTLDQPQPAGRKSAYHRVSRVSL